MAVKVIMIMSYDYAFKPDPFLLTLQHPSPQLNSGIKYSLHKLSLLTRCDIEIIIDWVNGLSVHLFSAIGYHKTRWMLIVGHVYLIPVCILPWQRVVLLLAFYDDGNHGTNEACRYIGEKTRPPLAQIAVCHLVGAETLSKRMLTIESLRTHFYEGLLKKTFHFRKRNKRSRQLNGKLREGRARRFTSALRAEAPKLWAWWEQVMYQMKS